LAYQVLGEGPLDLLCVGYGNLVSIDARDEEPHFRRFERRLASFSRFVRFDPRGLGLSDPVDPDGGLEVAVGDLIAVLDAVGSSRAALFAVGGASLTALQAAADYPGRVSSLVLVHGHARAAWADDYPCGAPQRALDRFVDSVLDLSDDTGGSFDDIALLVPSLAGDREFREWWKRAGQRSASPASARTLLTTMFRTDVRAILPVVAAPALVVHRTESLFPVALSEYLVHHLPNARLVQLSGRDSFPYAGDSDAIVDEIEEFLTGVRGGSGTDRVLTTLLFTDIVGSTERAVQSGDRRWAELLDRHDSMVRDQLRRFRGREVKTTGDGILSTFDSPGRGMQCAGAICAGANGIGIEVRAGLHSGEVEMRGDDVSGVSVHIAQRVSALAGPGEILVSRTVVDLVTGSGIEFDDRGEHGLKGVTGLWRVFAVKVPETLP
jgi:class 3 adenylate cyclase